MKLAVVAFPRLETADHEWVESIRAKHDPQAARIAAHFTLVFPTDASPDDVSREIAVVAESTPPFAFVVRHAEAVADRLGAGSHVFLVPGEGGAILTTLHDRLYAGTLVARLRSDVPFIPHITIGVASDFQAAARLAGEIDERARLVRGTIGAVELLDVSAARIRSLATYNLGSG